MRRLFLSLVIAVSLMVPVASASAQAVGCSFQLGFAALAAMIPAKVGACLENENHNPRNGDGLQHTTGGLMVWRKSDNWTAFTDGYHSWINGPNGLQQRLNTERFVWEWTDSGPLDPTIMIIPNGGLSDRPPCVGGDLLTFGPASASVDFAATLLSESRYIGRCIDFIGQLREIDSRTPQATLSGTYRVTLHYIVDVDLSQMIDPALAKSGWIHTKPGELVEVVGVLTGVRADLGATHLSIAARLSSTGLIGSGCQYYAVGFGPAVQCFDQNQR